jgi:hypothetical protein
MTRRGAPELAGVYAIEASNDGSREVRQLSPGSAWSAFLNVHVSAKLG